MYGSVLRLGSYLTASVCLYSDTLQQEGDNQLSSPSSTPWRERLEEGEDDDDDRREGDVGRQYDDEEDVKSVRSFKEKASSESSSTRATSEIVGDNEEEEYEGGRVDDDKQFNDDSDDDYEDETNDDEDNDGDCSGDRNSGSCQSSKRDGNRESGRRKKAKANSCRLPQSSEEEGTSLLRNSSVNDVAGTLERKRNTSTLADSQSLSPRGRGGGETGQEGRSSSIRMEIDNRSSSRAEREENEYREGKITLNMVMEDGRLKGRAMMECGGRRWGSSTTAFSLFHSHFAESIKV